MSIVIYTGKPRGGKSYRAHEREFLAEVLFRATQENPGRPIITNLAIKLPEFMAWLQKHHPACEWDPHKSLRILSHEETQHFYLRRTLDPSQDFKLTTPAEQKQKIFPDFAAFAGTGVTYIIDEAHVYFDSRCWAETGPTLTYYNSQHAKLNDRVVFITQFLELLDKRVKGFAQAFHVCRNYGKERFLTVFSMPKVFEERVFPREPAKGDLPEIIHVFRIDLELANTYDTMKGVGIAGGRIPERPEKKGLPVYLLIPAVVLLGMGVYYFTEISESWFRYKMKSDDTPLASSSSAARTSSSPPVNVYDRNSTLRQLQHAQASSQVSPPPRTLEPPIPPVRLLGWVSHAGRVQVYLSDGRVLTEEDSELERVDSRGVKVSGKRIWRIQGVDLGRSMPRPPDMDSKPEKPSDGE